MGTLEDDEDGVTIRIHGLTVSYRDDLVSIGIRTNGEDESLELAQTLVRHFKEYGAATIEILEKGGTLQ